MSRILNLNSTKTIVLVAQVATDTNSVSIDSVIDDGQSVVANLSFGISNSNKQLTLWSGTDYTNIGQWTDTDVNNRIIALLN
ncbi:MAG TPA: hypothetical protein VK835_09995 [Bacteroidia bacterium]|jgi:hypothetical protein|nr:hypothetical protein [Bacteroidia bacterium]